MCKNPNRTEQYPNPNVVVLILSKVLRTRTLIIKESEPNMNRKFWVLSHLQYELSNQSVSMCLFQARIHIQRRTGQKTDTENFIYFILFIYLFAHKSTIIIAIKYVKQGRTARHTRALTAALKTTNSNINANAVQNLALRCGAI